MLFHISIAADDPQHVAGVLAELMDGEALPFPPVARGSFIVLTDDAFRSGVEVYPMGTLLREVEGDADATGEQAGIDRFTATHAAIGTALDQDTVLTIAAREGWPAKYRKRGGAFGVIELWVEGRQMLEILTPEMQDEYRDRVTIEGWKAALVAGAPL